MARVSGWPRGECGNSSRSDPLPRTDPASRSRRGALLGARRGLSGVLSDVERPTCDVAAGLDRNRRFTGEFAGRLGQLSGIPTLCHYVDPRLAQGANWWANANVDGGAVAVGEAPLTAPFYVVKRNGYEERHWLAPDTGYDVDVSARRRIGSNARPMDGEPASGLEWFATSDLCDQDRTEVACPEPPPAPEPAPASEAVAAPRADVPTDAEAAWLWAALAQLAATGGEVVEAAPAGSPAAAAAEAEEPAPATPRLRFARGLALDPPASR